jgi:hypothetical protein
MPRYHCSCGFAIDNPDALADHLGWVFDPNDDIGNDGHPHAEITHPGPPAHLCACGYATSDTADFGDHLLLVVIPPDGIGLDGDRHVLVDLATPHHWYVTRPASD